MIGWYSKVLGFDPGFGVAVEKNGSSSNVFSMLSAGETCQFNTCNETIQHHTSALPLIRVEVGELILILWYVNTLPIVILQLLCSTLELLALFLIRN